MTLEDSVVIGYVHPSTVFEGFARSISNACLWPGNNIIGLIQASSPRQYVARNTVIEGFLEGPGEWLMWIDTDMTFEQKSIEKMRLEAVAKGADMATGLGFIYKRMDNVIIPNGYTWDAENSHWLDYIDYVSGHTYQIDGTGSGFVMIHRRVFEAWDKPRWHQNWFEHPMSGDEMGHDLAFFYQATQVDNFKLIWVTDLETGHIKYFELDETTFRTAQEAYRDS